MGKFLESEKPKQAEFKTISVYFSDEARADGYYKGHPYPFCLPGAYAEENLFPEIREPMMDYFTKHEIKWHDGHEGKPSNHLCDSQVCCANFLLSFFDKPKALEGLLRSIFPDLEKMQAIEDDQFVACEWIGKHNYLKEKISRNGKRTRGANFTSADAAVKFKCTDGHIQIVLIEWKYTESYYHTSVRYAASGTDKTKIYDHLYASNDCPIDKSLIPSFTSLFYDPFYQLMRQQFLANEMEKAHELDADIVSLLHIAPRHNHDFTRVTSPNLTELGRSATEVWQMLVKKSNRFKSIPTEDLFGKFDVDKFPELKGWWQYITARYKWVVE